jgi:hypothetical protein
MQEDEANFGKSKRLSVHNNSQFFPVRAMESQFFAKERGELDARMVEKCK